MARDPDLAVILTIAKRSIDEYPAVLVGIPGIAQSILRSTRKGLNPLYTTRRKIKSRLEKNRSRWSKNADRKITEEGIRHLSFLIDLLGRDLALVNNETGETITSLKTMGKMNIEIKKIRAVLDENLRKRERTCL